jgi:hypothetical protein
LKPNQVHQEQSKQEKINWLEVVKYELGSERIIIIVRTANSLQLQYQE